MLLEVEGYGQVSAKVDGFSLVVTDGGKSFEKRLTGLEDRFGERLAPPYCGYTALFHANMAATVGKDGERRYTSRSMALAALALISRDHGGVVSMERSALAQILSACLDFAPADLAPDSRNRPMWESRLDNGRVWLDKHGMLSKRSRKGTWALVARGREKAESMARAAMDGPAISFSWNEDGDGPAMTVVVTPAGKTILTASEIEARIGDRHILNGNYRNGLTPLESRAVALLEHGPRNLAGLIRACVDNKVRPDYPKWAMIYGVEAGTIKEAIRQEKIRMGVDTGRACRAGKPDRGGFMKRRAVALDHALAAMLVLENAGHPRARMGDIVSMIGVANKGRFLPVDMEKVPSGRGTETRWHKSVYNCFGHPPKGASGEVDLGLVSKRVSDGTYRLTAKGRDRAVAAMRNKSVQVGPPPPAHGLLPGLEG